MSVQDLERRVTALEAEVARLRAKVEPEPEIPWWEQIYGSFKGDPAFLEAMRLGREYRESLRPKPRKRRKR
jgi:hypothetical protein